MPQVVWLVNGQPASVLVPDVPLVWTMTSGRTRLQLCLPLQEMALAAVTVAVE